MISAVPGAARPAASWPPGRFWPTDPLADPAAGGR